MTSSGDAAGGLDRGKLQRLVFWGLVAIVVAALAYVGRRFYVSRDPGLIAVALAGLASLLVAYFTKALYDVNERLWALETHREQADFRIRRVGWPPEGGWIEFDVENYGGHDSAIESVYAHFATLEKGYVRAKATALSPRDEASSGFDSILVESGARVAVRAGEWEYVSGPDVDNVFNGIQTTEDGFLEVNPVIQRTEDSKGSIDLPPPDSRRIEPEGL